MSIVIIKMLHLVKNVYTKHRH